MRREAKGQGERRGVEELMADSSGFRDVKRKA